MHLNETGKELLTNQLMLHIFLMLDVVKVKPISMGWCAKNHQVDASQKRSQPIAPENIQLSTEKEPKRIRKVPVTRKDSFYGKFN
jgi:hypothetical protein